MKVFLDMDGVLVDFQGKALYLHGIHPKDYDPQGEWDMASTLGMTEEEFWEPMDAFGEAFWENLNWMPDGQDILKLMESRHGPENICLLSSPSNHPGSASGKLKWIQRHLPRYSRRYLLGPSKGFVAGSGKLLIDDRYANVEEFRKQGGEAILVPRPWNIFHVESGQALNVLALALVSLRGGTS